MTLSEFMQVHSMKDPELAAKIGVSRASVSRYRRGKVMPSPSVMIKITKVSKGQVMPHELLGLRVEAAE